MCLKLEAAETLLDRVNARGALLSSGRRVRSLDDDPDQRSRAVYDQLRRFIRKGRAHDDSATMNKMAGEFVVVIDTYLACAIEPEWLIDHLTEATAKLLATRVAIRRDDLDAFLARVEGGKIRL